MSIQAVTPVTTPATTSATTETPASSSSAPAAVPSTDAAQAAGDATKTIATDLPADEVKRWSSLQRANREAKEKITALEKERDELAALKPTAEKNSALDAHIKEGKMLAAAQAAGIDIEAAFSEWMADEEKATSGPLPKELIQLTEKISKLEAEREEELKARKAAEETQAKTSAEKATQAVNDFLADTVKQDAASDSPKWRRVAREPEAANEALGIVRAAVNKLGRAVTDGEAEKLISAAFDQLEEHYKGLAERYALDEVPPPGRRIRDTSRVREPVASRTVTIDNNRGSIRRPTQAETGFKTFKEIKAELMAGTRKPR